MWVNTELFRTEAKHFLKYGRYCDDPPKTSAHYEYWAKQLEYCRNGFSVGGKRITGHHYGYLNFAQIRLTEDPGIEKVTKTKRRRTATKTISFPDFWDGDYEYFWIVDIARNGIDEEELKKLGLEVTIKYLDGGYHLCIIKARRKGFSFKNGWIATNIYNTIRGSRTVIGAFEKKYLYPAGTMTMVGSYMDFLNEHTGWGKKRQVVNKQDHKRASYLEDINGQSVEKGYKSEVVAVTFQDNPDAARGKDSNLVIFEEAGAFDNLKKAFKATEPSVMDGALVTGQILIFGTGGDIEGGTADFESMYYNPEPYNLLPIENIWDQDALSTFGGHFFPQYKNLKGFYDKDGNSQIKEAKEYSERLRQKIKETTTDASVYDGYVIEYCFSPSEAFMQTSSNIFPVAELNQHRNNILRDRTLSNIGVAGILEETVDSGVRFLPSSTVRPILRFPHDQGDDLTGAVVIYQPPFRETDNSTPSGMYIIAHDPYAMDTEGKKLSLGAAYVIKRPNNISRPDDMIVASYVGRPQSQDDYNRNLFLLAQYYNAKIGFENDRGEVIPYAKRFHKLNYLIEEPELFDKSSGLKLRRLGRKYGMSMSSAEKKKQGLVYVRDWLKTLRSKDASGVSSFNLHYIYELPLLEELMRYNDKRGNFDRVSALLIGMYFMKALSAVEVEQEYYEEADDFFARDLYG
jgi:DNA-binding protein Fis